MNLFLPVDPGSKGQVVHQLPGIKDLYVGISESDLLKTPEDEVLLHIR